MERPSDSSYVSTSPLKAFPPMPRSSTGRIVDVVSALCSSRVFPLSTTRCRKPHSQSSWIMHHALDLVSSLLLYCSETWKRTIRDCNRLNAFDMSCLRRLENVKWYHRVRNSTIRQQTKQHTVTLTLTQRRLRWFGHLQCMPQSAGRDKGAVYDDGGWTACLKTSPGRGSSYRPSSHRLACRSSSCELYAG